MMTNEQYALQALRNAQTRAAGKSTAEAAAATLRRGYRSVELWLTGTHPKAR